MARKMTQQQLIDLTHSIIRCFYAGASALILEYLHSDIVWINNLCGQCLYGYYSVSSSLYKMPRPLNTRLTFLHSHLMSPDSGLYIVSCEYSALVQHISQKAPVCGYCSSFVWKLTGEKPALIYVHMSPSALETHSAPARHLSFQGRHAEVYRIHPDEILYIETHNIQCDIHCRSLELNVNQSISRLETLMPPYFMRTHRSFIVNKQYIRKIYRYGLELSNGIQLPVPEKRYMQVVCWLET